MRITEDIRHQIAQELLNDLRGRTDGRHLNILVETCPVCHKNGYKFGIYIGETTANKTFGSCHCFKCGKSCRTLAETLELIGREDLLPKETEDLKGGLTNLSLFDDEIDDHLTEVELPKGYKRCYQNRYLASRGFNADDYQYFECGTNRSMDWRLKDYVIFPIINNGIIAGYVSRHTWSKDEIDEYNDTHRRKIRRYVNSTDNEFGKLLYNYDSIEKYKTDTVILVEGVFDVIALVRKMELYDNHRVVPVCTFGKKISTAQIFRLQQKEIETVVIAYDADAVETTGKVALRLDEYFDTYVADLSNVNGKDFDEMTEWEIYEVFANHLKNVREFNIE